MRFTIVQRAGMYHTPKGGFPERFAPHAWDGQVGKVVPLRIGARSTRCTLVAAKVAEDGLSATLTIDTDDPMARVLVESDPGLYELKPGMSLSFTPIPAEPLHTDRSEWDPS